jgi:outer membrane lipase/esterase
MLRSLIVLLTFFTLPLFADSQPRLIFGDSLSDEGRFYQFTEQTYPLAPYAGGRFSNGPVWSEYLDGVRQNFAVSGATSSDRNAMTSKYPALENTGLLRQVNEFLTSEYDPDTLSKTIVYINVGGNDILTAAERDPEAAERLIPSTIDNIITSAKRLRAAGANEIILFGVPNLAQIPLLKDYSFKTRQAIGAVSRRFNRELERAAKANDFNFFDTMAQVKHISRADSYGITNTQDACLNSQTLEVCDNPNEYLYWDDLHPTTRVHQLFARILSAPF